MAIWSFSARRFLVVLAIVLMALAVMAAVFVWSGIYNVAASRGHLPVTAWLLEIGMRQSVKTHSRFIQVPNLDDLDMVRLGAAHYQGGCASCHGAPGEAYSPVVQNMLPAPSHLPQAVRNWAPEELFWIVRNGLKYTGMPAWGANGREDEVWSVVAFLLTLPTINVADYRDLAFGKVNLRDRAATEITQIGSDPAAFTACARCHGDHETQPQSRLVPQLAGQSAAYLQTALLDYARRQRQSGIMQPVAAELDAGEVQRLSLHYSRLAAAASPKPQISAEQLRRGQLIATAGMPENGIPPCITCHGGTGRPTYPKLAGQFSSYIIGQLKLFQEGTRDQTSQAKIMTMIARRLSAQQAQDVALFFEQLEPR